MPAGRTDTYHRELSHHLMIYVSFGKHPANFISIQLVSTSAYKFGSA
jgi:hypothetical protein